MFLELILHIILPIPSKEPLILKKFKKFFIRLLIKKGFYGNKFQDIFPDSVCVKQDLLNYILTDSVHFCMMRLIT